MFGQRASRFDSLVTCRKLNVNFFSPLPDTSFSLLRLHDNMTSAPDSIDPNLTLLGNGNGTSNQARPAGPGSNQPPPPNPRNNAHEPPRKTLPPKPPSKNAKKRKPKTRFANIFMPTRPQSLASKWSKAKQAAQDGQDDGKKRRRRRPGSMPPAPIFH